MKKSINRPFINPYYSKFQTSPSASDGVLTLTASYVEYTAKEKVKSSEYSLGNLIAIGAVDNLRYVSMSINSDMNFVDDFSRTIQSVSSDV